MKSLRKYLCAVSLTQTCANMIPGLESAAPPKGASMKRILLTTLSVCLLLGLSAAQSKTSTKKSAAKAAPAAAAPAKEAGPSHVKAYTPDQVKWGSGPNALPAGAQMAVLEGDPMKPGPFTIRLKFPNNYRIPPHSHGRTEHVTVLSGSIHVGMGDKFDEKSMTSFGPGS